MHPPATLWTWHGASATRDGKAGTISYADGHEEVWRWVEPPTLKPPKANCWPDFRPFVSNTDRDLGRIFRSIPDRVPII